MKILHLTNFFPLNTVVPPAFSGSERYVFDMTTRLAKRGHKIHIVYTPVAYSPDHKSLKFLPPKDVTMSYFPERFTFFKVLSKVKEKDPDIIHSHNLKMGAVSILVGMLLRKPVICSVLLSENEAKGWKRKIFMKLLQPVFKKINYIAISQDIAESVRADIGNAKIEVIPCWTWNYDQIKRTDGKKFRKKFPKNAKITFTISRIDEEKGLTYLFDAAAEILNKRKDVYFVISGGGPQLEEYRNLVKKMGIEKNVLLTGRITDEDLLESYKGCDVIVYPSPMDYLFSISESLATGRPIVATKVKSAVETYRHRENAMLVDPRNSGQIADAILEILKDKKLAERLSANAEVAAKKFHPDVIITKIENLYEKIKKADS